MIDSFNHIFFPDPFLYSDQVKMMGAKPKRTERRCVSERSTARAPESYFFSSSSKRDWLRVEPQIGNFARHRSLSYAMTERPGRIFSQYLLN